jgi:hypothetical protein
VALPLSLLAACGQAPSPAAPIGPPRFTAATCPHPAPHTAVLGEPPSRHAIPKTFHPTSVVRCLITSADGRSVVVTERADLTPAQATGLVRSLSRPSEPLSDPGCRQDSAERTVIVAYFVLVDAGGRALLPGLPADHCGEPSADALSSLAFTAVSSVPFG